MEQGHALSSFSARAYDVKGSRKTHVVVANTTPNLTSSGSKTERKLSVDSSCRPPGQRIIQLLFRHKIPTQANPHGERAAKAGGLPHLLFAANLKTRP